MSWGGSNRTGGLSGAQRARLRRAVLERDGYVCQIRIPGVCTYRASEADHIVDRAVAGDGLGNLQAACKPCNGAGGKGAPGRHDPEPRGCSWL